MLWLYLIKIIIFKVHNVQKGKGNYHETHKHNKQRKQCS